MLNTFHCDVLDKNMRRLRYNTGNLLRISSCVYYGYGTAVAVTYKNRFVYGALFEDFGQAEQCLFMEIVGTSGFRQRFGTAITPAVIDQSRAAGCDAYFFREVAPLTDAAQSFVEKYKHRAIVCFGLRPDKFSREAVFRRIDAETLSYNSNVCRQSWSS
jgi:hypothetical protein